MTAGEKATIDRRLRFLRARALEARASRFGGTLADFQRRQKEALEFALPLLEQLAVVTGSPKAFEAVREVAIQSLHFRRELAKLDG